MESDESGQKKFPDTEKADSHQCDAHREADRFESRHVVTTGIISPSRVCGLVKEFPARNGYAVLASRQTQTTSLCGQERARAVERLVFGIARSASSTIIIPK